MFVVEKKTELKIMFGKQHIIQYKSRPGVGNKMQEASKIRGLDDGDVVGR